MKKKSFRCRESNPGLRGESSKCYRLHRIGIYIFLFLFLSSFISFSLFYFLLMFYVLFYCFVIVLCKSLLALGLALPPPLFSITLFSLFCCLFFVLLKRERKKKKEKSMERLSRTLDTIETLVTETLGGGTPTPEVEKKFSAVFDDIRSCDPAVQETPLFCYIIGLLAYSFPVKLTEFLSALNTENPLRARYLERVLADSSGVALECLTQAAVVYDSARGFIDLVNGVLSDSNSGSD